VRPRIASTPEGRVAASFQRLALLALAGPGIALLALTGGCQESAGPRRISETREITVRPGDDWIGATSRERFEAESNAEPDFAWTMPAGWSQLPTRSMHLLDMKAGPDPDVECSLSTAGGSVLDNVNRWRGQFGQPALEEAALAKFARQPLLGLDAVRVEVEGSYAGMGKGAKEGFKLLGLIAPANGQQVFVKMTGPKAAVEAQTAAFDQFAGSLTVKQDGGGAHGGPHGGAATAGGADTADHSDDFDYALPTGWTKQKSDTNRIVNVRPADDPAMECYLSIASGGVLPNVNRWRNQFGAPPIDDAELAKLPRLTLFGKPAVRVEVDGTFTTMAGEKREGQALLGLVADAGGQQIFVKLTGPKAAVERERAGFVAFAASLRFKGGAPDGGAANPAGGTSGGASGAGGLGGGDADLQYDVPASWKKLPPRPPRLATFSLGESKLSECTVISLGGDGGGVAQNVNRWRDQMGLAAASPAELAKLPTFKVLGADALFVDLSGHFQDSMTKRDIEKARFLGLICPNGETTLFVKLTGPEPEVAAALEDFQSFCKSLRR
jgi:hypothetical protein